MFVGHLTDTTRTVRLLLLKYAKLRQIEDLQQFEERVRQSEPAPFFRRSSILPDLAYLHGCMESWTVPSPTIELRASVGSAEARTVRMSV